MSLFTQKTEIKKHIERLSEHTKNYDHDKTKKLVSTMADLLDKELNALKNSRKLMAIFMARLLEIECEKATTPVEGKVWEDLQSKWALDNLEGREIDSPKTWLESRMRLMSEEKLPIVAPLLELLTIKKEAEDIPTTPTQKVKP